MSTSAHPLVPTFRNVRPKTDGSSKVLNWQEVERRAMRCRAARSASGGRTVAAKPVTFSQGRRIVQ
jgi:hypothetical protein